jgi:acyl carrier protein
MTIFDRLRDAMAVTLKLSPDSIRETTTQEDLAAWDSLGHINLMVALETAFDITLEVEDFARLTSVPAILGYLGEQPAT